MRALFCVRIGAGAEWKGWSRLGAQSFGSSGLGVAPTDTSGTGSPNTCLEFENNFYKKLLLFCGSRMFIPDPNFSILAPGSKRSWVPDPGGHLFTDPDPSWTILVAFEKTKLSNIGRISVNMIKYWTYQNLVESVINSKDPDPHHWFLRKRGDFVGSRFASLDPMGSGTFF